MPVGPPPAADAAMQQQPPMGPFARAAQAGPQAQQQPQSGPTPDAGTDPGVIQATAEVVTTHLNNLMRMAPALTPFLQHAINDIQTGIQTVLANRQANTMATNGSMPMSGNAPPTEPGAGLPM